MNMVSGDHHFSCTVGFWSTYLLSSKVPSLYGDMFEGQEVSVSFRNPKQPLKAEIQDLETTFIDKLDPDHISGMFTDHAYSYNYRNNSWILIMRSRG